PPADVSVTTTILTAETPTPCS
ncbi:MAG: hypothetical protein JWP58_2685, partial [Hymenobacter sp.]|nr:hypothetical protein [Hymenobacter sp.]